jgi:hypothetical protein
MVKYNMIYFLKSVLVTYGHGFSFSQISEVYFCSTFALFVNQRSLNMAWMYTIGEFLPLVGLLEAM